MELPKFSFSLPVYNEQARLERCLQSIQSQDYPAEKIEVLVVDGGSTDRTKEVARQFSCVRLFDNPKKLADFGAKISAKAASGDLFVIFAADNELAGKDWLKTAALAFMQDAQLSALWGRMISAREDAALNKYYTLIQNDPLSFFINRNLKYYRKIAVRRSINGLEGYFFRVLPQQPLIWGANGLVYRTETARQIILRDGFIADNDVFQIMVEGGDNLAAYFPGLNIYHHHIKRLWDWVRKWKRNYLEHFLSKKEERNLRWAFAPYFKLKLFFWIVYSGLPAFSLIHSLYLAVKEKSVYWLYHPLVSFSQMATYAYLTIFTPQGRKFITERMSSR